MKQYEYEDIFKGKPRKLLILKPTEGTTYRVFCEASFLGTITPGAVEASSLWTTEYNLLKPIVKKIGEHIESLRD
jgi:hypothetical protein